MYSEPHLTLSTGAGRPDRPIWRLPTPVPQLPAHDNCERVVRSYQLLPHAPAPCINGQQSTNAERSSQTISGRSTERSYLPSGGRL
jgi:hypothetical protein